PPGFVETRPALRAGAQATRPALRAGGQPGGLPPFYRFGGKHSAHKPRNPAPYAPRSSINQARQKIGLGGALAVHRGLTPHLPHRPTLSERSDLKAHDIARDHRPPKSSLIDPHE